MAALDLKNAQSIIEAGADVLVAGSGIFNSNNPKAVITAITVAVILHRYQ